MRGENMIRKVKGGYVIYSETTGKRLSKVYPTKQEAEKRLRQIEYFKHKAK